MSCVDTEFAALPVDASPSDLSDAITYLQTACGLSFTPNAGDNPAVMPTLFFDLSATGAAVPLSLPDGATTFLSWTGTNASYPVLGVQFTAFSGAPGQTPKVEGTGGAGASDALTFAWTSDQWENEFGDQGSSSYPTPLIAFGNTVTVTQ